jgi:hypothetical protein
VKPATFGADRTLRSCYRFGQRGGTRGQRHVVQIPGEGCPIVVGHLARGEFIDGFAREVAEAVGVELIERHANDAATGDEPRARQMQQTRDELAPGKITRRPHQHYDLRKSRTDTRQNFRHGVLPSY